MKQVLDKKEEDEKLQEFIFSIDDNMNDFIEKLSQKGYTLNYNMDSLDVLEKYLINENITNDEKDDLQRVFSWTYLGEVFFRLASNAVWEVSMNEENTANYGLYVLKGHDKSGIEFVPIKYIRVFIMKKQKGFLKKVVKNHLNPMPLNLDKFPTEKS